MRIRAEDLAAMLRKMDGIGEKAQAAFSSYSQEDQQAVLEGLGELRQMLYSVLAQSDGGTLEREKTE